MSSGVKGSGSRVTIPNGAKEAIENIKEAIENINDINGLNHTEDEIYAMLKECSMDPNETPIIKEKNKIRKIDEASQQIEEEANNRRMRTLFSDFMTRVAKFEELASVGSRLLVGFQQAIGYLTRPPIDDKLLERIVKARNNSSTRVLSYIEAGCVNAHDSVQNVSKLHTCHLGLQEHVRKAKSVVDELETILEDTAALVVVGTKLEEEVLSSDLSMADYASVMAIIYSMVKQDYTMQDRIVLSLGLKSSLGELETYCQMWSLRPFVDDQIMQEAWNLVS